MRIIKEGKIEKTTKMFVCKSCGCQFIADGHEYKLICSSFMCKCPCCNQLVTTEEGVVKL